MSSPQTRPPERWPRGSVEFRYSSEELMVRDMVREFAAHEIRPYVKDYEARGEFPSGVIRKIAGLGLAAPTVPEKYGGGGVSAVAYCLAHPKWRLSVQTLAIVALVVDQVARIRGVGVNRLAIEQLCGDAGRDA